MVLLSQITIQVLFILLPINGMAYPDSRQFMNNRENNRYVEEPISTNNHNYARVNRIPTVDDIQKLLAQNQNLPRLTKGEVEDLIEKVSKDEYEKSLKAGNFKRANYMRSLMMLVLPYNPNSNNSNVEDLFSRPPVTKVISRSESRPTRPLKPINIPSGKVEIISIGENPSPTTYKPILRSKGTTKTIAITTYRPTQQILFRNQKIDNEKKVQSNFGNKAKKFSSHYSAKNLDFTKVELPLNIGKSKIKRKVNSDIDDIMSHLSFTADSQPKNRYQLENRLNNVEIAPRPVMSSQLKETPIAIEESQPLISANLTPEDFIGFKSISPKTNGDDYVAFKPINVKADSKFEPELEDYLFRFGLLNENSRSLKNSPPKFEKNIQNKTNHKIERRIDTYLDEESNIFKPGKADYEDLTQIKKLLKNIEELQHLNISLSQKNLKNLNTNKNNPDESLLTELGPDPNNPRDNKDLDSQLFKNEVKRQNEKKSNSNAGLSLDTESDLPADQNTTKTTNEDDDNDNLTKITTETTTTTEESKNGNISDLEDSFGGNDKISESEDLPPPRKNGFYFLADVNSFLEVGEDEDKIAVRFNPKVGDPSRFIPVHIPSKV